MLALMGEKNEATDAARMIAIFCFLLYIVYGTSTLACVAWTSNCAAPCSTSSDGVVVEPSSFSAIVGLFKKIKKH